MDKETEFCTHRPSKVDGMCLDCDEVVKMPCECGSTEFYVFEKILHDADLVDGVLEIHKDYPDGISKIVCKKCDKTEKDPDYTNVQFI